MRAKQLRQTVRPASVAPGRSSGSRRRRRQGASGCVDADIRCIRFRGPRLEGLERLVVVAQLGARGPRDELSRAAADSNAMHS